jgi:hypothetical protein
MYNGIFPTKHEKQTYILRPQKVPWEVEILVHESFPSLSIVVFPSDPPLAYDNQPKASSSPSSSSTVLDGSWPP